MAADTAGVDRTLGAIGTTFRLMRLYPPTHPAVIEALRQIAELAGLLYARGVRAVTLNPGMTPDHVLALFQVATGAVPPDDRTLGRITLALGRRTSARLERLRTPTPTTGAPAIPEPPAAPSAPAPSAATTEQSTAAAADAL